MGTKTQKLSNVVDSIVEWQSVFTGDGSTGLTAVAGRGYFIDTTSGTVTVTLPASPKAGDVVQLKDYARTWATNAVSIASTTFDGVSNNPSFSTKGQTVTLVYMDGTKGWSLINEDTTTGLGAQFVTATGGTITTLGDYKIHTFTGDGCFVVSDGGNPAGSNSVDYLVVAGGGGGGGDNKITAGGGGGAGGFRYSASTYCSPASAPGHPLRNTCGITVTATTYPITVGAGGAGACGGPSPTSCSQGSSGSNSVFSTITSTGGGGGGADIDSAPRPPGLTGGSGGGSSRITCGAAGNTPPVSPPQGNSGGNGTPPAQTPNYGAGGGGGAIAAGTNGQGPAPGGGPGGAGAGLPNAFGTSGENCGSYYYFSGGGGGGIWSNTPNPGLPIGIGGLGGGGDAGAYLGLDTSSPGSAGTGNTGGGGGGATGGNPAYTNGGAGGKGIVIIRYKYQ